MANNVTWTFKAVDLFSSVSTKINNASAKTTSKIKKIGDQGEKVQNKIKKSGKGIEDSLKKIGDKGDKVKDKIKKSGNGVEDSLKKIGDKGEKVKNKVKKSGNGIEDSLKKIGDKGEKVNNKVKKSGKGIGDTFKKVGDQGEKAEKKIKKSGSGISDSFNKMAAAAAAYLSVTRLLEEGSSFQDSLADLSSITGATGEKLGFLSNQAFDLAKNFGVAQSVVVNAFTDIASAKSELLDDPRAITEITAQALLLAKAAKISVPDAVQASVGALNQFGEGADQAARFVNVLAAGSKVGAARVSEVVESMKNAGSVASQFNVSFEETNALIQVLAKNGVKAAEAGTAVRGTLSKLEKISNGKLAPSKIGILKSLEGIEKLSLSNTEVIKEFGEENLRSILILRKNIPLIKDWTNQLTGTQTAQEQASIQMSTFSSKMKKMGVVLNQSLIKTFLKLEPMISKQAVNFTEFLDSLKPSHIQGFADAISVLAAGLSVVGKVLGTILEMASDVAEFLGQLTAAIVTLDFGQFTDGMLLKKKETIIQDVTGSVKLVPPKEIINTKSLNTINQTNNTSNVLNRTGVNDQAKTTADVTVKLVAPERTVESVSTNVNKKNGGMNVGVNMVNAL